MALKHHRVGSAEMYTILDTTGGLQNQKLYTDKYLRTSYVHHQQNDTRETAAMPLQQLQARAQSSYPVSAGSAGSRAPRAPHRRQPPAAVPSSGLSSLTRSHEGHNETRSEASSQPSTPTESGSGRAPPREEEPQKRSGNGH